MRSGKWVAMYADKASLTLLPSVLHWRLTGLLGWGYWLACSRPSSNQLLFAESPSFWQKLCSPQQVAILVGAKLKWKSLCLRRTLHLDFNNPNVISTPTLNDSCWRVRWRELGYPLRRHLRRGYTGRPKIKKLTSWPLMFFIPWKKRYKDMLFGLTVLLFHIFKLKGLGLK